MSQRPTREARGPIRVRATQMGYINEERKRAGDVFDLKYAHQFSAKWMERVNPGTPLRTSTGQQSLDKIHDDQSPLGKVRRVADNPDDADSGHAITERSNDNE